VTPPEWPYPKYAGADAVMLAAGILVSILLIPPLEWQNRLARLGETARVSKRSPTIPKLFNLV